MANSSFRPTYKNVPKPINRCCPRPQVWSRSDNPLGLTKTPTAHRARASDEPLPTACRFIACDIGKKPSESRHSAVLAAGAAWLEPVRLLGHRWISFVVGPLGHDGLILWPSRGYPPTRIMRYRVLLGLCLTLLVGCATYHDDLERGQHYYDLNQYNNALSVWRMLEIDWDSLTYPEQARYAYLRGMTDYRMGFRADARHWLATSKAVEQKHPGGLDAQTSAQLEQVLTELNAAVYAMGPPPSAAATGVELTNVTAYLGAPAQSTPIASPAPPDAPASNPQAAPAAPPASNPPPPAAGPMQ